MSNNIGKVSKVIGAVVDVEFSAKDSLLPEQHQNRDPQMAKYWCFLNRCGGF